MILTQKYLERSGASINNDNFTLNVATEQSRPSVHFEATIRDGLAYSRLMLALYRLVTDDQRAPQKDRSAYFEWVHQRYLDELSETQIELKKRLPELQQRRVELQQKIADINHENLKFFATTSDSFWQAKGKYWDYLFRYARDKWWALDPVISVHPDCVIFEAFSQDESSYGRFTVPMAGFDRRGHTEFGTTNIDFSPDLAREIGRIRSYRPADLEIGADRVVHFTRAGGAVEKKIDLPPSWVRGFLQVQSAGALPGVNVLLSSSTLAEILSILRRKREDKGPRSLRFHLTPGAKPEIMIEPWGIIIKEPEITFTGPRAQEIRIWGRRRLMILEKLLSYSGQIQVRLLGTGLPSYWSVWQNDLRLDIGLSGWTRNDWSQAAQFDFLASSGAVTPEEVSKVAGALKQTLSVRPEDLAANLNIGRGVVTAALQQLCREGQAMFDYIEGTYRWRQLFPFTPDKEILQESPQLLEARKLINSKSVRWLAEPLKNPLPLSDNDDEEEDEFEDEQQEEAIIENGLTRFAASVSGKEVVLDLDADGRVNYVRCECRDFQFNHLRKGPCAHILAATILAAKILNGEKLEAGTDNAGSY